MQRTGRPRDPHIDGAVLDTTLTMLSETGYHRLSVEKVARRAGTTKPAIYRRWPSRQHLVLAALTHWLGASRTPDTGCTVRDLNEGVGVFLTAFRRLPPDVLAALLADCTADDLRTTFMTTLFDPPRTAVAAVLDRALARGDVRADLDRDLTVDLLAALVHYRTLYGHAPTDAATVEHIVTTLLNGIAVATEHRHQLV